MSTRFIAALSASLLVLASTVSAADEVEIFSPGFPPSRVAADGAVIEPWGRVRLVLLTPEGAKVVEHRAGRDPMPQAVTRQSAGTVTLAQTVYRAPVWPSGADVLEAALKNTGKQKAEVKLELVVPEDMDLGETTGSVKGRPALALPANLRAVREERDWGCAGGVRATPGWAKPAIECDPAFRNISVGFNGAPITYRFAVDPGGKRTVLLGFCESHHPTAGLRPLVAEVEGRPNQAVDPIESWGRNIPGVVRFDASDANRDGRLQVSVLPHPSAGDRNTILNVIWVFPPDSPIDEKQVIAGALNAQAERYVDVGGENDQGLYKKGNIRFVLPLEAGESREFFFLLQSPGCQALPDLSQSPWCPASLRRAAADVWRDRWVEK